MLFFFLTCGIVDVGQRVELVDHDVDVVATDAMRLAGDALAFIHTSNGVELARGYLVLDAVEVGSNSVDTGGVAHENHLVSQEFGLQMKVET